MLALKFRCGIMHSMESILNFQQTNRATGKGLIMFLTIDGKKYAARNTGRVSHDWAECQVIENGLVIGVHKIPVNAFVEMHNGGGAYFYTSGHHYKLTAN